MQNIDQLLRECGASLEHICKVTVYLTDIRHRPAIYQVLGRWLKGVFPVFTGLVSWHSPGPSGWWKSTWSRCCRTTEPVHSSPGTPYDGAAVGSSARVT
jgi:hypothetical protein